jgi:Leucine-rich repeat (LRR) protein
MRRPWVYYDYQFDDAKPPNKVMNESPWPSWLIEIFGIDMLHNVVEVNLVYSNDRGKREETRNTSDEIIPKLEAFPNLRRLYLHSTQVTDDTMPHVGRLRKLEEFFVWDATQLSDNGVEYLRNLDRLWSIHISNSRIGDDSLGVMSRLPRLERLSLQGNRFSDEGLAYLENMRHLKILWVGLGHGQITDQGANHLLKLRNLEELDLQGYVISNEMRISLKNLPKLKQLVWDGPYAEPHFDPRELEEGKTAELQP